MGDVSQINSANITYHALGPNSNSALGFMLNSNVAPGQVPWFNMPWMVGSTHHCQGSTRDRKEELRSITCRRGCAFLGTLVTAATACAGSDSGIPRASLRNGARDGLTPLVPYDSLFHQWRGARLHRGGLTFVPAISPDCLAMCWGDQTIPEPGTPFLTVDSVKEGTRSAKLEGQRKPVRGHLVGARGHCCRQLVA